MKVVISAERASDVSVLSLEIKNSGKDRVVLTFGDVLEVAIHRDELMNALLALDGEYSIASIRHELKQSRYS